MTSVIFAVKLLLAVPVALVLALTAMWYIWESGNTILYDSFAQKMFAGIENYGLLAIPLFMLTGELMNEGGMTARLIRAARVFVGGFRGGLVYINLVANMFMAAIIGSATAQISIMSRTMVPEMEREGYDRGFAAATTAAGGLLAPMIPPSMMFVIYGVLAQIAIGDMFIAGILPGLLLAALFACVIAIIGLLRPFPHGRWLPFGEAWRALLSCVPAALIPIAIIGGILFGLMTPTESAAVASLIAFFIGWRVYKELKLKNLARMFRRTAINASMIIFMVAAANVFGWVIIYEAVPQQLAQLITSVTDDAFVFLLIVTLILLLVGTLIDGIAAVILITPILLPIALDVYGISPFQFGVVVCLNLVLGLLTPPIGIGLYLAAAVGETPMERILKSLWPFLFAVVFALIVLCYFPALSTALL